MLHHVSTLPVRLLALVAICACFGCQSDTRSKVDLSKNQIKPGHEDVVIGQPDTPHTWDGAAKVPLSKDGEAKFLWDDKGVYGRVASNVLPSNDLDEEVCVLMSFSNPSDPASNLPHTNPTYHYARLAIYSTGASEIKSRLAGVSDEDRSKARFFATIAPDSKSSAKPWSAEFFIPWELISGADKPTGTLFVNVYRVKGERPYSLLELKLPPK